MYILCSLSVLPADVFRSPNEDTIYLHNFMHFLTLLSASWTVTTQLDAPFSHRWSDHYRLDTLFDSEFDLILATRVQHSPILK